MVSGDGVSGGRRQNRRRLIQNEKNPPGRSATERVRREGGQAPPVAIIWPYPSSVSSYVSAGQQVVVPPQHCPTCQRPLVGWGGYWRWLRAPLLVERIWIRRGRCAACRRSHALVPDLVLVRRLDVVTVIGHGVGAEGDAMGWGCGRSPSSWMCRTPRCARGGNAFGRARRCCWHSAPRWR